MPQKRFDVAHECFRDSEFVPKLQSLKGRILEIGGNNYVSPDDYLSASSVTVIDLQFEKLPCRAASAGNLHLRIQASAEALPFAAVQYDAIIFRFVYCSLRKPREAVQECWRVCRKGGIILMLEHVPSSYWPIALCQHAATPLHALLHANCHLNRNPLSDCISVGFSVVDQSYMKSLFPWMMLQMLKP